uniref:NADH-ubiquinone oxidoreductase chain 3 n=1 Tax=Anastatus dexingensis TaxID=2926466 RepID=A0A9E8YA15_9HYME|nr:NADH dehydrogenase subunit 3 [Anastatus dexingensis]WAJ57480.1 NADH dehydrogenase subunit 3 [Anastatus dexingensis]
MLKNLCLSILILLIVIFMYLMNFILSKKMNKNREKMSPFECGFDPMSKNRLPFSLQFYLISIIFLIFDVEIAIILPMIKTMNFLIYFINFNLLIIFIILILGIYIEWFEGGLDWFK